MQDSEAAAGGDVLFLSYGATEEGEESALRVGNEIIDAVQRHGLRTDWDGTLSMRIGVQMDWKRRIGPSGGTPPTRLS